jgi:hypothetical protein
VDHRGIVRPAICFAARNAHSRANDIDANDLRIAFAGKRDVREARAMKCRMCSQVLTRPGKLCRECERELERARRADFAVDELAEIVMRSDAGAPVRGWSTKLRTPRNVIALAFCVGIAGAVSAAFVQHDSSRTPRSVMLDMAPAAATHRDAPPRDAIALRDGRSATAER